MNLSNPVLAINQLSVDFHAQSRVMQAVRDVSLHIDTGEIVALVGESGSGKSVLALSIMQLLRPSKHIHMRGSIIFEGNNLITQPIAALENVRGNRLAIVFQDALSALNPFLTIERQLTEVLQRHQGIQRRIAKQHACEALQSMGLHDATQIMQQYPHQLSGGMRQRVLIAMSMLCQPTLIIADEPTTALDANVQQHILHLWQRWAKEYGTSIFLISHDLSAIQAIAQRVLVMYAGCIVEEASTNALFTTPKHPYTAMLLQSVPTLQSDRTQPLHTIVGMPPDASALPQGCSFAARCPYVEDRCKQDRPKMAYASATHRYACVRHP